MLGLCCCIQTPSSCGQQGLLFVAMHGLLIAVASLGAEHRLEVLVFQQLQLMGAVIVA